MIFFMNAWLSCQLTYTAGCRGLLLTSFLPAHGVLRITSCHCFCVTSYFPM